MFLIRLYSNPSGNEARKPIGQKSVASFRFDAPRPVSAGHAIAAIATDTVGGNTSEPSGPVVVAAQ